MKLKLTTLLVLTLLLGACKKEDVSPTGSLKLTYQTTQNLTNPPNYALFTEALYSQNRPLKTGTYPFVSANRYEIILDDLNPGTYIFQIGDQTGIRVNVIQVTGGRQREYSF